MRRRPVDSSVLLSVGYDPERQILEVELATRRVYRYYPVPELVHRRLLQAPSVGQYFNAEIRDHYECVRVDDPLHPHG
jgi:hypothetical protein